MARRHYPQITKSRAYRRALGCSCIMRPPRRQNPGPRIYLASLADYNAGRHHGAWVEASSDEDEMAEAAAAMLARSKEPYAEEFAIHDYEGFGPVKLGEFTPLSEIAAIMAAVDNEYDEAMAWAKISYLAGVGYGPADWADKMDEVSVYGPFHGDAETEFAEEFVDSMGGVSELSKQTAESYFDYAKFGRDLSMDYTEVDTDDGAYFMRVD